MEIGKRSERRGGRGGGGEEGGGGKKEKEGSLIEKALSTVLPTSKQLAKEAPCEGEKLSSSKHFGT